jgi:phage shock protein PspC (stress-responsive transcriptional regulator)
MNEITQIHLGRESYTISIDAHQSLKKYLAAIRKAVDDDEVANEVEVRMSELLIERGVTKDKVILPEDITYLKQQLGDPADFNDEEVSEKHHAEDKNNKTRRLFRDTDNAMFAGVAAGLANYTGLDVVIVRILFVLLIVSSSGFGGVLYILLWLVVPPASTTSEKLQMHGKPVTLEALKDSVSKADVAGATQRINQTLIPVINNAFRILLRTMGTVFIIFGLAMITAVATVKMYMLLHNGKITQENYFPVGIREEWLLGIAMTLVGIIALFLMLTGIATFKRKWPIRGWTTGILAALFLSGSIAAVALAGDAVPHIRDRYEASVHTVAVKDIKPFNKVVSDSTILLSYSSAPDYRVDLNYKGQPDISKIKVEVHDNTLYIDSGNFKNTDPCTMLCIYPHHDMVVWISAPNVERFDVPSGTEVEYPLFPPRMR